MVAPGRESGTGKLALLRAVHQLHNPTRSFRVLDPPKPDGVEIWSSVLADAISARRRLVVLEHADRWTT